jgi:predicted metal-dependent phosphoesterase TrpH
MLKAELHSHINLDPIDKYDIHYSAKKLIDEMKRRGYDVLAITCHDYYFEKEEVTEYAKSQGITLIPGIEKTIEKKHTLIYNAPKNQIEKIRTLKELEELKEKNPQMLIIAPHPFFKGAQCHKNNLKRYKELFDAYEYSFFYTRFFNMNKKMLRLAKRYKKPVVGNCDIHSLDFVGNVYRLIDSKPNKNDIIKAIKSNKIKLQAQPLPIRRFTKIFFRVGRSMLLCKLHMKMRTRH